MQQCNTYLFPLFLLGDYFALNETSVLLSIVIPNNHYWSDLHALICFPLTYCFVNGIWPNFVSHEMVKLPNSCNLKKTLIMLACLQIFQTVRGSKSYEFIIHNVVKSVCHNIYIPTTLNLSRTGITSMLHTVITCNCWYKQYFLYTGRQDSVMGVVIRLWIGWCVVWMPAEASNLPLLKDVKTSSGP